MAVHEAITKDELFDTFKNTAEMEKIEVQVLANLGINNPYL